MNVGLNKGDKIKFTKYVNPKMFTGEVFICTKEIESKREFVRLGKNNQLLTRNESNKVILDEDKLKTFLDKGAITIIPKDN